jgi:Tfp pilus assembly protein PilX
MKKNQSGSVLLISLVLLTVITLVTMMSLQRSGLQTKVVANAQHREIVFNTALNDIDKTYSQIQAGNTQELSDAIEKPEEWVAFDTLLTRNRHATVITQVKHIWNGNALGNPNTSRLRNTNSRGKNGAGVENFIARSVASLPNDMKSAQQIGISIITPEQ